MRSDLGDIYLYTVMESAGLLFLTLFYTMDPTWHFPTSKFIHEKQAAPISPLTRNEAVLHANVWLLKKLAMVLQILAKVLQSHFKHGGQNAQQQRFARIEKGFQTCKGKNMYSGWDHRVCQPNRVILNPITCEKAFKEVQLPLWWHKVNAWGTFWTADSAYNTARSS